ncbi:putative ribitol kinase or glycerol kinase, partial [Turnera subulata]
GKLESNPELPLFVLETVACATNNFSGTNKLGLGGYRPVYKVPLLGGAFCACT